MNLLTSTNSLTAQAGEGALSVQIRAAGQEVNHSIQDLANGQYDILFYPTMAIPHKFDVKYNGLPITSSPIEAKVILHTYVHKHIIESLSIVRRNNVSNLEIYFSGTQSPIR